MDIQSPLDTPRRSNKRRSSQVPATYSGFSQQTFRAVVHLLRGDSGATVSVEVLDDIATAGVDAVVVEQAKNARSANPIRNNSTEWWKTLANWLDAVDSGSLVLNQTKFILSVRSGNHGLIAESFAAADGRDAARAAIAAAKAQMASRYGPKAQDGELRLQLERVFQADEERLIGIVQRFSIERLPSDVMADIELGLKTKAISPALIPRAALQMLGWVQKQLQQQHENGQPPAVAVDRFYEELTSFARAYDRDLVLSGLAAPPTDDEIRAELPGRVYIEQLALIDATYDEQLTAAAAYLRATADRVAWSDAGFVHESAYINYAAELTQFWEAKRNLTAITLRDRSDIDRGKVVFYECCTCKPSLAGAEPPSYFSTGSLHALSDAEVIGWHPAYKEELSSRRSRSRRKAS